MITMDKNFKGKAQAFLESMNFDAVCIGIYKLINEKCDTMPPSDERDFIEALIMKQLIDRLIDGWKAGCEKASFNPKLIADILKDLI